MFGHARLARGGGFDPFGGGAGGRRLPGLRRPLRRVLRRRRRRRRAGRARRPAPTCATTCADLRRVDQRRREGDRVHLARRAARRAAGPAPSRARSRPPAPSATARASCATCARRCSARWSTSRPATVQRHRQDRRDAVPHLPRRRPRRAQAQAARDDPGRASTRATRSGLSGEGEAAPRGGVPGNLYVVVHVAAASQLRRQDTELFYELPLIDHPGRAGRASDGPHGRWRGGDRDQGRARRPGSEIRLRGKGVPHLRRSDSRGDLHVLVDVRVPSKPDGAPARAARAARRRAGRGREPEAEATPRTAQARAAASKNGRKRARAAAAQPAYATASGTRSAERRRRGHLCRRKRGSSSRFRADHEAVEQVSEILSRVCTGGVSVEAPFESWKRACGGSRHIAAGRRPRLPRGRISRRPTAAIEQVIEDLGHLQAFELRPIGELRTRLVHEEDWAEAWKEHFPVMRVGQRLVIRPTWRELRAEPERRGASASTRAWPSAPAFTRRRGCAWRASRRGATAIA